MRSAAELLNDSRFSASTHGQSQLKVFTSFSLHAIRPQSRSRNLDTHDVDAMVGVPANDDKNNCNGIWFYGSTLP